MDINILILTALEPSAHEQHTVCQYISVLNSGDTLYHYNRVTVIFHLFKYTEYFYYLFTESCSQIQIIGSFS